MCTILCHVVQVALLCGSTWSRVACCVASCQHRQLLNCAAVAVPHSPLRSRVVSLPAVSCAVA
jgi:hypothetical protein